MNLDPLKPYADLIRTALWIVALLVIVALSYYAGTSRWHAKHDAEAAAHASTKAEHKRVLDDLARATAEVARKAKAASKLAAQSRRDNDTRYDKAVKDAKRARADLRDALRNGGVRLQPWWDCAAGPAEGDAAALASGQDAAADLRAEGAADLIADNDHADAWINWLQTELTVTRSAVVEAGCAVVAGQGAP